MIALILAARSLHAGPEAADDSERDSTAASTATSR